MAWRTIAVEYLRSEVGPEPLGAIGGTAREDYCFGDGFVYFTTVAPGRYRL